MTGVAAVMVDGYFYEALRSIREQLRRGWGTDTVNTRLGTHGVVYTEADDSEEPEEGDYATVGFVLPNGLYAEIEDGTYGQLQGLRLYRADLES